MAKSSTAENKQLNSYLEQIRKMMVQSYQDLVLEKQVITAEAIKNKFLGLDISDMTLCKLIEYHNTNCKETLRWGTLKNYFTTKKAIMISLGVIEHRDIPKPGPIKDNEILLRIKKIGVCGSDIHVFQGEHPATPYPVVQGHEYSATIVAIGDAVKSAKVGQRATARPQLVCGKCGPCLRGQYNACQELKVQGFQAPGVAQEYFVVPEDRLIVFPDSMSYEHGAMIEPAAVGAYSTSRSKGLEGKNVVVSGAGTIGNLVAQFAKARGAKKVVITDVSDFKTE